MDFDAKILWTPGLELTASLFRRRDEDMDERYRSLVRAALGWDRTGIMPGCEFCAEGGFVKRTYELNGFKCTALLYGGGIVTIDEDLKVDVPRLKGTVFYLCVEPALGEHKFERDGIPYSRPTYSLSFRKREEMNRAVLMPVKKFIIEDGMLNCDTDYIVPTLSIASDTRFSTCLSRFAGKLKGICHHRNMERGECQRTLIEKTLRLEYAPVDILTHDFIQSLVQIAGILDYYVVDGLGAEFEDLSSEMESLKKDERRNPDFLDIAGFLNWFDLYLDLQVKILDKVVIVDNTIDYDLLKKQITDELHSALMTELSDKLYGLLDTKLTEDITATVTSRIETLVEENIKPELKRTISDELRESLYKELYDALYSVLYEMFKPSEEVEETFTPMI